MAFQNKHLSVLAYANGITTWSYVSPDTLGDILSKGYFKAVKNLMNPGDHIIVASCDNIGLLAIPAHNVDTDDIKAERMMYASASPRTKIKKHDCPNCAKLQAKIDELTKGS